MRVGTVGVGAGARGESRAGRACARRRARAARRVPERRGTRARASPELTKIAATRAKADRVAELLAADEMLPEPPHAYRGARAAGDVVLRTCRSATAPTGLC